MYTIVFFVVCLNPFINIDYSISIYTSVFYVFYEQYLTVVKLAALDIGLCIAAIYIISCVLLGFDFYAAFLIALTILFIIIDMFGLMYLWDIPLNAVRVNTHFDLFVRS